MAIYMKHLDIKIVGYVQGVSFRLFARGKAQELGLFGFVQNEDDGSVYIEVEGDEEKLNKFVEYLHQGPVYAKVEEVKVREAEVKKMKDFHIN